MKKMAMVAVALAIVLASCGSQSKNAAEGENAAGAPSEPTAGAISEYFPIRTNTNYHYESPGNPALTQDIYVAYTGGSRIQRRASSADGAMTEVLQYQNGELRLVYGEPNFYFYEDLTGVEPITNVLLLKEPLEIGQKWGMDEAAVSEITNMGSPVSTPQGNFSAMEVTTEYSGGFIQKEYYAKGSGLVKTVYTTMEGKTYEIVLVEVTEQAVLDVPVDFYYPDPNAENGMGKEEKILNVGTNANFAALITAQAKIAGLSGYVLLPGSTEIRSIELNRPEDMVVLELSDNGVGNEEGLLCLAETLGHFYGVGKFRPTNGGADYKAGGKTYGASDFIEIIQGRDAAVGD